MIILYGKKYARNKAEYTETLFQRDGTANGFYKVNRSGIVFSDMQGKERVFIRKDGLGPVSISRVYGKLRYMFSTATSDESWLGMPESYSAKCDGAREVARGIYQ